MELISFGPAGRLSYFAEWRALSQSIGGNRRLLDRSGRFEDLFVRVGLDRGNRIAVTAGQFRALTQVDVSLRALRLQGEQRVQRLNHVTGVALSHIF